MYDVVEICPWCESENYYPDYDVEGNNYRVKCKTCGKEILLCDECLHADDNKCRLCDWHEKEYYMGNRIKVVGICHRNITHNDICLTEGE